MPSPRRRQTSRHARFTAPLALLAAFAAVVLVVRPSGDEEAAPVEAPPAAEQTTPSTTDTGPAPAETTATTTEAEGPATYTVQAGDTLSAIATETGVPVEELAALNPDANPSALTVGDELRLRDDGDE